MISQGLNTLQRADKSSTLWIYFSQTKSQEVFANSLGAVCSKRGNRDCSLEMHTKIKNTPAGKVSEVLQSRSGNLKPEPNTWSWKLPTDLRGLSDKVPFACSLSGPSLFPRNSALSQETMPVQYSQTHCRQGLDVISWQKTAKSQIKIFPMRKRSEILAGKEKQQKLTENCLHWHNNLTFLSSLCFLIIPNIVSAFSTDIQLTFSQKYPLRPFLNSGTWFGALHSILGFLNIIHKEALQEPFPQQGGIHTNEYRARGIPPVMHFRGHKKDTVNYVWLLATEEYQKKNVSLKGKLKILPNILTWLFKGAV